MTQAQIQTQTNPKTYTFDEFIEWYPENSPVRYELHNGVIIEMAPPTGDHEDIVGFLTEQIVSAFKERKLPYTIPKSALVKTPDGESAYIPDVLVLNRDNLKNEPLWKKESTVLYPESVALVVEVVSTNWRDDYYNKFANYEEIGIPEYWIVDYAALGGRKFIGNPKQPTVLVCELIDGEYQITPFRGSDLIVSRTFPDLNLTAQQVFDSVI
ncbi:Uma2 family endonuclease [Aetokthonos hydrillicola Thurmond2011]|jgi:Uma2 family endonuclease|uniref:Uma2 family endonuclease n=1 Tax=Aetokthonos hydrillicola Thurmond2011 TaxID=2712845 RepID=A0AAP5I851_9CYAN|nr:Uma2 family endonuclease [Aetokthonos hydrillicola]MBO3458896.1 Uma2 family endonuclease [Aetokthonos hydrillicola CCALA 1050]MBW4587255.1 Uma2 family endonuclease [Aetokthonos hydrillicola CCALA 1050]MDR9896722.1 Uma2 family endonuclease [Aetokthonos hydrillicola Thurmond2011]